jgi:hypothetical protein
MTSSTSASVCIQTSAHLYPARYAQVSPQADFDHQPVLTEPETLHK